MKNPFPFVTTSSFVKLGTGYHFLLVPRWYFNQTDFLPLKAGFPSFLFRSTSAFTENRWNSSGRFRGDLIASVRFTWIGERGTRRHEARRENDGATMPVNLFPSTLDRVLRVRRPRCETRRATTTTTRRFRLVEDANRALNRLTF